MDKYKWPGPTAMHDLTLTVRAEGYLALKSLRKTWSTSVRYGSAITSSILVVCNA